VFTAEVPYIKSLKAVILLAVSLLVFTSLTSLPAKDNNSSFLQTSHEPDLKRLRSRIDHFRKLNDTLNLGLLADSLKRIANQPDADIEYNAKLHFNLAIAEFGLNHREALSLFEESSLQMEEAGIADSLLMQALYMVAWLSNSNGNTEKMVTYLPRYLEVARKLSGEVSMDVEDGYSFLIGAYSEIMDYSNFENYTLKALRNLEINPDIFDSERRANLYTNIGAGYSKMGNYSKAIIYLEKAQEIRESNNQPKDENYIVLMNNIAIDYGYLNNSGKENESYQKGIQASVNMPAYASFNLLNSYALSLARNNKVNEGEEILLQTMEKVLKLKGIDDGSYIEFLNDYSTYIGKYLNKTTEALDNFKITLDFIANHPENHILNQSVLGSYAKMLFKSGDMDKAMSVTQALLFGTSVEKAPADVFLNPPSDSINADKFFIDILELKYKILKQIFDQKKDCKYLEAAAGVTEYIISVIDRMRVNISEESSRFILGSKYRNFYPSVISDFNICYLNTGEQKYLEKAFIYAEKSKVAGLLTATREMNAIEFKIPLKAGELEKNLQSQILFLNYKISRAEEKDPVDSKTINSLKTDLLSLFRRRDSLIMTFEKDFPGYYAMKYDTKVPSIGEIPSILGRKNNYLNYVVSDSVVFIFVVNRKYSAVETIKIDSGFIGEVKHFRQILSDPSGYQNARTKFNDFQKTGYDLYSKLIKPVQKYLISDDITIAPDNILSYIPFETLITKIDVGKDLYYRDLDYLMDEFNITYTYSATFSKETVDKRQKNNGSLVAFAPYYSDPVNADSLLAGRQVVNGMIYDLPEARNEAEYVARLSGGKAFLFNKATESEFKKVAGNYDVIHLAMHTILNDRTPMNSAMVFNTQRDSSDDRYLYTHEVYGLSLKARMVVLSSCNTGSGLLSSGEGILSLARGFLYAGSKSVVMSMWEIDDKSGTDVVKMFYDHLLSGESKGEALRTARREYLKNASQLRSHPYYWSSLVIYGDSGVVFRKDKSVIYVIVALGLAAALAFYLWRRKYS
jgi:CHAT domain-containing protein